MEKEKYEKLLEDLTAELKKLNGNLPAIVCEINHLREAIKKAEAEAEDFVKSDGKQRIEKRG